MKLESEGPLSKEHDPDGSCEHLARLAGREVWTRGHETAYLFCSITILFCSVLLLFYSVLFRLVVREYKYSRDRISQWYFWGIDMTTLIGYFIHMSILFQTATWKSQLISILSYLFLRPLANTQTWDCLLL